jgi:L-fuculokinase
MVQVPGFSKIGLIAPGDPRQHRGMSETQSASPLVLALDCGATSLRAILVTAEGRILAHASRPSETRVGEDGPGFHVWDFDRILGDLATCANEVMQGRDATQICAVTVTTFGCDGAWVNADGSLRDPIISWKCPRTGPVMAAIGDIMPMERLQEITGTGRMAFNTIYKLLWLQRHRPQVVEGAAAWMFISSLINHRLTGEFTTDHSMAGTSQLTDLRSGDFSGEVLGAIGIDRAMFPRMVRAGEIVGALTPQASAAFGLGGHCPPVVSAGHDTQFAVFGSGAEENQPVLSSGTWEILMVRAASANLGVEDFAAGATCEFDAAPGLLNPGLQWLGSGVLEWIRDTCYRGEGAGSAVYETMIREAAAVAPGCEGVTFVPDFLPSGASRGRIDGLRLGHTRGHVYRAALEALSARLADQLARLEQVGGFSAPSIILVGGATRNAFWTQLRANAIGRPVRVRTEPETTVLGAAMFAFAAAGIHPTAEAARVAFGTGFEEVDPIA